MNRVGTLIGGVCGFLLKGPLGALLGAAIGYYFDKHMNTGYSLNEEQYVRVQSIFFRAAFSIMGHIAKADGRVSEAEIAMARRIMDSMGLSEEKRQEAIRYFNQGKTPDFAFDSTLEEFRQTCIEDSRAVRMFLEILFTAAFADGELHQAERQLLSTISGRLGMSTLEFERTIRFFQAQQRFSSAGWGNNGQTHSGSSRSRTRRDTSGESLRDAYAVLGVSPSSSPSEIKKAYRRLISQHHPDKLASKGVPEEVMKLATEKTQRITKAYELVMAQQRA